MVKVDAADIAAVVPVLMAWKQRCVALIAM
jgi:hypothetical protein